MSLRLEIWPGYVNTIQHYDGGLLLMLDVSHRVLRTDTVLDFLLVTCVWCVSFHLFAYSYELYSKNKSKFQEEATRQLVGCIVLTRLVLELVFLFHYTYLHNVVFH